MMNDEWNHGLPGFRLPAFIVSAGATQWMTFSKTR